MRTMKGQPMTTTLQAVEEKKRRKSPTELEIERLASLEPAALTNEDLFVLRQMRDARSSLMEAEIQKEELKERLKLRKANLDLCIKKACDHFENRQLALGFKRD